MNIQSQKATDTLCFSTFALTVKTPSAIERPHLGLLACPARRDVVFVISDHFARLLVPPFFI